MAEPNEPVTSNAGSAGSVATDDSAANAILDGNEGLVQSVLSNLYDTLGDIWTAFTGHIPFLLAGFIVLVVTWVFTRLAEGTIKRLVKRTELRDSLQQLLIRLIDIVIWTLGLLVAVTLWFPGMTPTSLLGGLGLLSVAVGFAFQDIFENFFAGILLLWRFPFEDGDYIACEGIEGQVVRINIRMTEIRQTSGELVLVPNSMLFKNPVEVLTDRPKRRVMIICGVAYDEDVASSIELIEGAVRECDTVMKDSPIQVFAQGFGESSIDIEVAWWTEPKPVDIRRSRGEVVTAIKRTLDEAGVEIPFPYRTLTFKEPLGVEQRQADGAVSGQTGRQDGDG